MIGGIATTIGCVTGMSPPRGILLAGDMDESLANSTLTPNHNTIKSTPTAVPESDEDILAFFQRDYNEKGDGGCSDEE